MLLCTGDALLSGASNMGEMHNSLVCCQLHGVQCAMQSSLGSEHAADQ